MRINKQLIIILVIWSIAPLIWQLYTSFSTPEALINPFSTIEHRWTFQNYLLVLNSDPPFWIYLTNSTILAISTTILTLIISIPAGYGLSRSKNKMARLTRSYLLSAALFPYVLLFLALLEAAKELDIGNNLIALSIPYTALSLPLAILLLSSAFDKLPKDLEEAATIEGLNLYQRTKLIFIPLIAPTSSSIAILIFIFSWNEYPIALTWISNTKLLTLPVAIARIAGSSVYEIPYGAFAAATVIASIPLILMVLIFQKQIISGLTKGAIKG